MEENLGSLWHYVEIAHTGNVAENKSPFIWLSLPSGGEVTGAYKAYNPNPSVPSSVSSISALSG